MRRKISGLVIVFMLIGVNLYAADGDLIVNGAISTGAGQSFKIRYGSGSYSVNIAAGATGTYGPVDFGFTFSPTPALPPIVMITGTSYGGARQALNPSAVNKTSSGFTLKLYNSHGSTVTGTYTFDWIAIGQ
jgi:hypothetical protein